MQLQNDWGCFALQLQNDKKGFFAGVQNNVMTSLLCFSNFVPYNINPICYYYEVVVFKATTSKKHAGVAELADAPGLGSGG